MMQHGYPGILRGKNEFDPGLGEQMFRGGVEPPRTGGGLLPDPSDQFNNRYIRVSRNNHINAGFNPEYIKFVEDCMLVLFLLCVLITLLVVHRASCARHTTNSINMASHVQSILGVSRKSAETPPPPYDEALAISQALSASMVTSDPYQPSLQISSDNNESSSQPSSQSR